MPRRSTRAAQPTQDDIEVDEQEHVPSQQDSVQDADQPMESAEEEEPEQKPLARSKKSNATKSKSKTVKTKMEKSRKPRARRDASDDESGSDGGGAAPPFDKDEFLATARPIPQHEAKHIGGLMSDLKEVLHQVEHVGFGLVSETAVAVEEVSGGREEGQEAINQLDIVMRQLIDAQRELTDRQESFDALKQRVHRGDIMDKLEDAYTSKVDDAIETYARRTTRQKYAKNDDYFKFRERVWEVSHDDAMPPIRDLIPPEDGDSDIESDIEIGGMTQDYKCPLTLTLLTNPLTSKLCDHSFSAEAIREYIITSAHGRRACPASGCDQMLTIADLEPNKALAKRAGDAARRAKRREEDSGDDSEGEVVD